MLWNQSFVLQKYDFLIGRTVSVDGQQSPMC